MLLSKPPFSVLDSLTKLDDLIDSNAELADAIFVAGFKAFLAPTLDGDWIDSIVPEKYVPDEYKAYSIVMDHMNVQTTKNDMDKARTCINQFYREWSAEGAVERSKCFDPVLAALEAEYPSRTDTNPKIDRSGTRILVPGAGLGRFVFDVCRAGFRVEGNEISYHELMASSFVLHHIQKKGQFTIAPFALNGSNHLTRADQFQTCQVPDIHPNAELCKVGQSKTPVHERMSMATGDFCVLYNQENYAKHFDAVATVFFIDTAPNVIRYIEAVCNCLKSGGIWINLGPLLWHHAARRDEFGKESDEKKDWRAEASDAGIGDPGSVELTNEEVITLVEHFGFTIEKQEAALPPTGYINDPRSMLQSTYRPTFWLARKN